MLNSTNLKARKWEESSVSSSHCEGCQSLKVLARPSLRSFIRLASSRWRRTTFHESFGAPSMSDRSFEACMHLLLHSCRRSTSDAL